MVTILIHGTGLSGLLCIRQRTIPPWRDAPEGEGIVCRKGGHACTPVRQVLAAHGVVTVIEHELPFRANSPVDEIRHATIEILIDGMLSVGFTHREPHHDCPHESAL